MNKEEEAKEDWIQLYKDGKYPLGHKLCLYNPNTGCAEIWLYTTDGPQFQIAEEMPVEVWQTRSSEYPYYNYES
jgi:hypothetical protein